MEINTGVMAKERVISSLLLILLPGNTSIIISAAASISNCQFKGLQQVFYDVFFYCMFFFWNPWLHGFLLTGCHTKFHKLVAHATPLAPGVCQRDLPATGQKTSLVGRDLRKVEQSTLKAELWKMNLLRLLKWFKVLKILIFKLHAYVNVQFSLYTLIRQLRAYL